MDITVRVSWLENLRNEIFKDYYARVQRRPKGRSRWGYSSNTAPTMCSSSFNVSTRTTLIEQG